MFRGIVASSPFKCLREIVEITNITVCHILLSSLQSTTINYNS
jgi:hypothetical protein